MNQVTPKPLPPHDLPPLKQVGKPLSWPCGHLHAKATAFAGPVGVL
jgi:hypothetical protein